MARSCRGKRPVESGFLLSTGEPPRYRMTIGLLL